MGPVASKLPAKIPFKIDTRRQGIPQRPPKASPPPQNRSEGLPEWDISSLGVMGGGLGVAGIFFRRRLGGEGGGL